MPSLRLPILALVLCALLPSLGCTPEKESRKSFKDGAALFFKLERASPERCYLDPRMGQVEDLLKRVPPESSDYATAQGILKRISQQRAQLQAQAEAANPATAPAPTKAPEPEPLVRDLSPEARVEKARAVFERYVRLERDYDPILPELYAPDLQASVADGHGRTEKMDYGKYRKQLLSALGQARRQEDRVEYKDVKYEADREGGVRISGTRESEVAGAAPFLLQVAPDASGQWLVHQAEMTLRLDAKRR